MLDITDRKFIGAILTSFGVKASSIKQEGLVNTKLPEMIRDEIPTLNRMGYMKLHLDEYSQEFVDYAAENEELVLEIGCAYGFVVGEVLNKGGKIIASDLSDEHLKVVLNNTHKDHLEKLYLYPAHFPTELNLPQESLGAVLASRIMHFLDGDEIIQGLGKINNWLKKGGKFYFTAVTPYHDSLRKEFESIYHDRVEKKVEWPGIIENQWLIAPMHKEYVEPFLNVFDIPQLESLLIAHGFQIDKISLFSYPEDTASGDIGHIGCVATKI